jgi:thiol-disulfide isomerase/thioredoxin
MNVLFALMLLAPGYALANDDDFSDEVKSYFTTEVPLVYKAWPKSRIFKWPSKPEYERLDEKPVMVIVTQPWCSACKRLKQEINVGFEVKLMLGGFTIIHAAGDDGRKWLEKGHGYVPQVYFYSSGGSPMRNITHPKEEHAHFFGTEEALSLVMRVALQQNEEMRAVENEITEIYRKYTPEKLHEVPAILSMKAGSHEKLLKRLKKKYEPENKEEL